MNQPVWNYLLFYSFYIEISLLKGFWIEVAQIRL